MDMACSLDFKKLYYLPNSYNYQIIFRSYKSYIDISIIFYDSKHFHSFLMKKKGQYSYSYHVNKLCEKLERGAKLLQHKIFSRVKWFRSSCVTTIRNYYYAEKVHAILISCLLSKRKGCYKFFDYSSFIKQENLLIYYLSETVIGVKFYNFLHFLKRAFKILTKM